MITQILSHTPLWVFGLFFGLVYLGYLQSRTRRVSRQRLIVLPLIMLGWSLYSVWSTFDTHLTALAAWACVWSVAVAAGLARAPLQGASYDPDAKQFTVPGSWVPLALMMGIFFFKYAVAVVHAVRPEVLETTAMMAVVAGIYGLFSGLFMARALRVLGVMKPARLVERSA
jgi:hypothetical protein